MHLLLTIVLLSSKSVDRTGLVAVKITLLLSTKS